MSCQLYVNDWRLTVVRDGLACYEQPAVALDQGSSVVFGTEALTQARVHPRQSNADYLGKLNADPLSQPFQSARNHADLVYLHLRDIAQSADGVIDPTVAVVSSTMNNEQLSLLLGVAQEAGIRIGAFVDLASLAIAAQPSAQPLQFVELNLTNAYQCQVQVHATTQAGTATEFTDVGINRVVDGWTNVIADQFVQSSRFDPLHAAHTEQQLYNLVTDWFGTATPSSYLTIEHNGETRRLEISIEALRSKLRTTLEALIDSLNPDLPVRLGPNAASVPLLGEILAERFEVQVADREDLYQYLNDYGAQILTNDAVEYVHELVPTKAHTSAPPAETAAEAPPEASTTLTASLSASQENAATHGLHATTAYAIGSQELPESATADASIGTTVEFNGRLFTLIKVVP